MKKRFRGDRTREVAGVGRVEEGKRTVMLLAMKLRRMMIPTHVYKELYGILLFVMRVTAFSSRIEKRTKDLLHIER
jgi:hypothetical protein